MPPLRRPRAPLPAENRLATDQAIVRIGQLLQQSTSIPLKCSLLLFLLYIATEDGYEADARAFVSTGSPELAKRLLPLHDQLKREKGWLSYLDTALRQVAHGKSGPVDKKVVRELVLNHLRPRSVAYPQFFTYIR